MDVLFRVKEVTMFCILIFLLSFSSSIESSHLQHIGNLPLHNRVMGPDSLAFDSSGGGPYASVADGRIVKYGGPNVGFQDYAYTARNRSKAVCDGYNGNLDPVLGPKCGRPLGIAYNRRTAELHIADAYLGLLVFRKNEKFVRTIATSAGGVPFKLLDGLDVDYLRGFVYFTDASSKFGLTEFARAIAVNDSTGRLLKYDLRTKTMSVLLSGLSGPTGVAVSNDGAFLLVTEFIGKRIRKYWLRGPKANTAEILLKLPGRPDNIKSTAASADEFWVAVNEARRSNLSNEPSAYKISGDNGTISVKFLLSDQYKKDQPSEVHQVRNGTLYIGSMTASYIAVLSGNAN